MAGKEKNRGWVTYKKFEYLKNKKKLLDEIKGIFLNF